MALLGELFESARAGGPLSRLGLGAARQAELAEQDVPELLGAPGIDGLAGNFVDLCFEAGGLLRELAGEPRQQLPVDRNAAALHPRQHGKQRPLQRLVDGAHALGRHPRLEHMPQPENDVGPLGAVFGRMLDAEGVEADLGLAGLEQLVDIDRGVGERALGERNKAMVLPAGIEGVRHQHHIVVGPDGDAAQRQHLEGEFQIVSDLEHACVFEKRLERVERRIFLDLIRREIAAKQAGAITALPMRERHVTRFVRRDGER